MVVNSRACPLCSSKSVSIIAEIRADQIINSSPYYNDASYDRLGVTPSDKYGISRCVNCRFVFASNVPDDNFFGRLYMSDESAEKAVSVFARPSRAAYSFGVLSRLLFQISERIETNEQGVSLHKMEILDVGCAFGVGITGLTGKYFPYSVSGVEISKSAREYLSQHNMHVYTSVDDLPSDKLFHGILLNDVLEHVPEPKLFMTKIKAHIHPDGLIWVNVPNFIDWRLTQIIKLVNDGSMQVPKDMNPWEHLSYFNPSSLDSLMGGCGLQRIIESSVEYRISLENHQSLLKSLFKLIRDFWRIRQKHYPSKYTTSALYSIK